MGYENDLERALIQMFEIHIVIRIYFIALRHDIDVLLDDGAIKHHPQKRIPS